MIWNGSDRWRRITCDDETIQRIDSLIECKTQSWDAFVHTCLAQGWAYPSLRIDQDAYMSHVRAFGNQWCHLIIERMHGSSDCTQIRQTDKHYWIWQHEIWKDHVIKGFEIAIHRTRWACFYVHVILHWQNNVQIKFCFVCDRPLYLLLYVVLCHSSNSGILQDDFTRWIICIQYDLKAEMTRAHPAFSSSIQSWC